jgi:fibronectin-binding autotransporter adhesin
MSRSFQVVHRLRCLALIGAVLLFTASARDVLGDTTWTGAVSSDMTDAGNWSNGLPGPGNGAMTINSVTTNIPVMTTDITLGQDLLIGTGSNTAGRLDQISGTLSTGSGAWANLGFNSGSPASAIYNLADTTGTGGTFTGYAQGSGSFVVGQLNTGWDGGTTSTVNVNTSGTITANVIEVGSTGGGPTSTFNIDSGTVNVANNFEVGGDQWSAQGGSSFFNMSGGSITTGNEFWGGGNGTTTAVQTGGSISSAAWFVIGRGSNNVASYTLSGGTVTAATSTVGSFAVVGSFAGSQGTLTVSGGTFQTGGNRKMFVGENGTGILNVSGTGHVLVNNNVAGDGFRLGGNSGSSGTVNLTGGTLEVAYVAQGSGTGAFNFDGGTLKVASNHDGTNSFMSGLGAATVLGGGAVIDTNGNAADVLISQALLDGSGGGGLTKNGLGTLVLSGTSTYTGATVVNAGTLLVTGALSGTTGVSLASGASIGGTGSIAGDLTFGSGTQITFDPASPLTISGTANFASPSTFGIDDILGVSSSTPAGIYTLIAGTVDTTGLANFGAANAYDLGSGVSAYFQSGSLQMVVVPEPASVTLIGFAAAATVGFARRRFRR